MYLVVIKQVQLEEQYLHLTLGVESQLTMVTTVTTQQDMEELFMHPPVAASLWATPLLITMKQAGMVE